MASERWLTASETLLTNGFPILLSHANPRGSPKRVCSFQVGEGVSRAHRCRREMAAQSGNALNIPIAGMIELYMLLYCIRTDESFMARVAKRFGGNIVV
jgi:hypothetical protein